MKHREVKPGMAYTQASAGDVTPDFLAIIKAAHEIKSHRILRIRSLRDKSGRGISTIWDDVKSGVLPPPIHIGERAVGWKESEIDACLAARSLASRTGLPVDMRAFVQRLISISHTPKSQINAHAPTEDQDQRKDDGCKDHPNRKDKP